MKSILIEDFEDLKKRIESGKATEDQIKIMIERFDAFVESWSASADLSRAAAKRFDNESHAYSVYRDILKEKLK